MKHRTHLPFSVRNTCALVAGVNYPEVCVWLMRCFYYFELEQFSGDGMTSCFLFSTVFFALTSGLTCPFQPILFMQVEHQWQEERGALSKVKKCPAHFLKWIKMSCQSATHWDVLFTIITKCWWSQWDDVGMIHSGTLQPVSSWKTWGLTSIVQFLWVELPFHRVIQ